METFKSLVDAVLENNQINGGSWKDWDCATHIEDTYGLLQADYKDVALAFLDALIRDNGENLETYLSAMHALEYGN